MCIWCSEHTSFCVEGFMCHIRSFIHPAHNEPLPLVTVAGVVALHCMPVLGCS